MTRTWLMIVLIAAFTCTAFAVEPTSSPSSQATVVTLRQAIDLALANNASMQNAHLEVVKGEARLDAAKTHRLPLLSLDVIGGETLNTLSFEIKEGQLGSYDPIGPVPYTDTKIELASTFSMLGVARVAQPLTQLYSIGLGIRATEASLSREREKERSARLEMTREVKVAYFDVLTARSYASAANEAVKAWEEVDREMTVRASQQAILEADRLESAAQLAQMRLTALSAEDSLATARDRLSYLVGQQVDTIESSRSEPITNEGLADSLVDRRPDVRGAEIQVEQARLGFEIERATRIPDISLSVSYAIPINNDVMTEDSVAAGISMRYEPFTWGRRSAEIAEKKHALEQAQNALVDTQAAARLEIAATSRKVKEAAAQISVRELETNVARERLRVTRARFDERAARADDVYSASASLAQAAAAEQEAVSVYQTALADYQKAIAEE